MGCTSSAAGDAEQEAEEMRRSKAGADRVSFNTVIKAFTRPSDVEGADRFILQKGVKGEFEAQFSLGQVLGRGGFARVLAVRRRSDGERLAVKIVTVGSSLGAFLADLEGMLTPRSRNVNDVVDMSMKDVVSEVATWSAVQGSKHVVNLVFATMEDDLAFMVMEKCDSNILRKISDTPAFWKLEQRRVLKEMLLGMQACHAAEIVHRDIKPENFLLGSDGSTVKLCDFGLAARMHRNKPLKGMAGTMPFISPEVINGSGYGKAADMWSYGVMSYFLCFKELPFGKDSQTLKAMSDAENPTLLNLVPVRLENGGGVAAFIGPQLELSKSTRCTVEQALAHWYLHDDAPASADFSANPQAPRTNTSQKVLRPSEQSVVRLRSTATSSSGSGLDEMANTPSSCNDSNSLDKRVQRPSGGSSPRPKKGHTSNSVCSTPRLLLHMLRKDPSASPTGPQVPGLDFNMSDNGCGSADSASYRADLRETTPQLMQHMMSQQSAPAARPMKLQPIISGSPLSRIEMQSPVVVLPAKLSSNSAESSDGSSSLGTASFGQDSIPLDYGNKADEPSAVPAKTEPLGAGEAKSGASRSGPSDDPPRTCAPPGEHPSASAGGADGGRAPGSPDTSDPDVVSWSV